jgi:histone deacetylase 11
MLKKIIYISLMFTQTNLFCMEKWPRIPIVYHEKYNVEGVQRFRAPREIYQRLLDCGLNQEKFSVPVWVYPKALEMVHKEMYLKGLNNHPLMNAAMYATSGTFSACQLAPKYGWAINLGGGFNLALPDQSVDDCILSDVSIAINSIWNEYFNRPPQILVIDLSAKQNTSYVEIFQNIDYKLKKKLHQINVNLKLFQMYASNKFTTDDETLKGLITFNRPFNPEITGNEYLAQLKDSLVEVLEKMKIEYHETGSWYPEPIIYVAGTDLLDEMPNIQAEDIIKRDELVFSLAEKYKIPIAMVLGSCISQKNSDVAYKSILNILRLKKVL